MDPITSSQRMTRRAFGVSFGAGMYALALPSTGHAALKKVPMATGIDALFVAQGIHATHLGALTAEGLAQLFVVPEAHPKAAMQTLVW